MLCASEIQISTQRHSDGRFYIYVLKYLSTHIHLYTYTACMHTYAGGGEKKTPRSQNPCCRVCLFVLALREALSATLQLRFPQCTAAQTPTMHRVLLFPGIPRVLRSLEGPFLNHSLFFASVLVSLSWALL